LNRTLGRLRPGTPPLPLERVRSFIGEGARVLVARGLAAAGLPDSPDLALALYLEEYRGCLLETTRPYPGAVEALDRLAGHTLAVLTNKPGDMSRGVLEGLGLAGRFLRIYGGGDLPERKPHPLGLERLMQEAHVPAARTVLVGDSAIDVRTARAAGVPVVGVRYGFDPNGFEAEPPDRLVDDAAAVVEAVEALLARAAAR
jgi:phosphoglycolate phosphatase